MRSDKTCWNRSYKDPKVDTKDEMREERKRQRRERQRTAKQKYAAVFWDKHFEVNHGLGPTYPNKPPKSELDKGDKRKEIDDILEDRRNKLELKEVWDD